MTFRVASSVQTRDSWDYKMDWYLLVLSFMVVGGAQGRNRVVHGIRPQQQRPRNPVVGYIGGPQPDITITSMYHLFRIYRAIVQYKLGNLKTIRFKILPISAAV